MKALKALVCCVAAVACTETAPGGDGGTPTSERNLNFALQSTRSTFAPFVDPCLTFIQTGRIDAASLQAAGYEEATIIYPTYSKKLGRGINNKAFVQFAARQKACSMNGPAVVSSAQPMAAFIHRELEARGYQRAEANGLRRGETLYTRGDVRVVVSGFTYNATMTLRIAGAS